MSTNEEQNIGGMGEKGNTKTSASPGRDSGKTGRSPSIGDPLSRVWPDGTQHNIDMGNSGRHSSQGDDSTTRGGSERPSESGQTPAVKP